MYENIAGISIEGRCFTEKKDMIFFQQETDRLSIVYGKNGCGKSTLTQGFREIIEELNESELNESELNVKLINRNCEEQNISENLRRNLVVFDEKYVDKNIRIDKNGLNTIVLFGDQVDVEEKIKDIKLEIESDENSLKKTEIEKNKYNNNRNIIAPEFYIEKIKSKLKMHEGWAEIDSKIKGNKNKSAVTEVIINEIANIKVKENRTTLQMQFNNTQDLLAKISDTKLCFPNEINKVTEIKNIEDELINLLGERIEKPLLTEREKLILIAIEDGFQNRVDETKNIFIDDKVEICPYCYQPLSREYKAEILDNIKKVLNKDVESYIKKMKNSFLEEYAFDSILYNELDSDLVSKIKMKTDKCNEIIKKYNEHIQQKIDNVFSPITIIELGLNNNINELNLILEHLEKKRIEFNEKSKKVSKIRKELIDINKKIAHIDIVEDYKIYEKQLRKRAKIIKEFENIDKKLQLDKNILEKLKAEKMNVSIAINQINKSLEYVFFSKDRLRIELKDDLYYLKSNDEYVKPCEVSCGERNIVALCYFFTQIMKGLELKQLYSVEKYIVIDDPVSSFDFENKIGIMSFLKKQFSDIMIGNNESKIVILSHDLTTIFDLQKVASEICALTKRLGNVNNTTFSRLEIKERSLIQFGKNRSEYTELLKLIFEYAKDKSGVSEINIGNTMRRVLEAFSTFSYKKSIQDISCNPEIMENIPRKEYFENLMYRLVLHNESHYEEQIQNFHDGINFYDFVSADEKQKTAREVLCLIYLLNSKHLEAHLNKNTCSEIKTWIEELA